MAPCQRETEVLPSHLFARVPRNVRRGAGASAPIACALPGYTSSPSRSRYDLQFGGSLLCVTRAWSKNSERAGIAGILVAGDFARVAGGCGRDSHGRFAA